MSPVNFLRVTPAANIKGMRSETKEVVWITLNEASSTFLCNSLTWYRLQLLATAFYWVPGELRLHLPLCLLALISVTP